MQVRRERHDKFKAMRAKILLPRILYLARLSFRFDGEIKSFTNKQKMREFSTTKPALQQLLKELLYAGKKRLQLETRKLQVGKFTGKGKHTVNKIAIRTYTEVITLNIFELNAST